MVRKGKACLALVGVFLVCLQLFGPLTSWAKTEWEQPKGGVSDGARVIVTLQDAPLARALSKQRAGRDLDWQSAEAVGYLAALTRAQEALASEIEREFSGAFVEGRYQVALNGLAVRLPRLDAPTLERLRALPGVKAIYEEVAFAPALYASLPAIKAQELWAKVGGATRAGRGVKIAILDSGIDITHPMFDGTGFAYPSGFPKGDARYTNPKVIVARVYLRPADPPIAGEGTPQPGLYGSGHGTHVAGIAAGNRVVAEIRGLSQEISGVAPKAWLMNYRIFYPTDTSGLERAYTVEIVQAIEDAIKDGADVICTSWSSLSPRLPFASAEAEALDAAMEAGCVVVAPAGNDGAAYGSASRLPGGIERVITVGAVSKDRVVAFDLLDVTEPEPVDPRLRNVPFARALFGGTLNRLLGPWPYVDVNDADPRDSSLACNPLVPGSLVGKVALISRGECTFADKAFNVQKEGARLALIYNTTDELFEPGCGGEHCDPGEILIPAALITRSAGEALLSWLRAHPAAKLQLDPNGRIVSAEGNVVQQSSGRGPSYARYLKPDVVAPGVDVLSAYHERGTGQASYAQLSGSSMACAHVAGAAALLIQAHPSWRHDQVKAALMATANAKDIRVGSPAVRAGVLDRGAGLIDLSSASNPELFFSPPSLALPHLTPGQQVRQQIEVTDTRAQGGVRTWTISVEASPNISVTAPTQLSLGAGRKATFEISVTALSTAGDGWADLHVRSGLSDLHIPIWVHIEPSTKAGDVLVIDNDFSQFESYADYAGYVARALESLGLSYQVWDADIRFGNPQTIPDLDYLQRFSLVIWVTGDNVHPDGYYAISTPLTSRDLQVLASYLDAGGRLIAWGQNLAEASDVNADPDPTWGRAGFYHSYLGAHWLQGSVYGPQNARPQPPTLRTGAVGLPGTFLSGVTLDIGPVGDGAHNQISVDEIAPGGFRDGSDADLVQPVLMAVEALPIGPGYIGVIKADEPTLEREQTTIPYRTAYYAFGFEGINNNPGRTGRVALLKRTIDWLRDEVTVALEDKVASANDPVQLSCQVSSSVGASVTSCRWRIGQGEEARTVVSDQPTIAYLFPSRGRFPISVEVTDSLGHKAVAHATVLIADGGSSTLTCDVSEANPGETISYQVLASNTGPGPLSMSFTLPLPPGTEYVSHTGGSFSAGALRWSGSLAPGASFGASLRVRVRYDSPSGVYLVATAEFRAGQDTFTKQVRTWINSRLYLPLLRRP